MFDPFLSRSLKDFNVSFLLSVIDLNIFVGTTIDQVKNGVAAPYLQIREGLGANRALKSKVRKKKKGDTRQCQTGMMRIIISLTN